MLIPLEAKRSAVLAAATAALAVFVAGAAGAGESEPSFAPGAAIPGRLGAVADFNGDGRSDLAVIRSSAIAILLGDARGGFKTVSPSPVKTSNEPDNLQAADLNGDRISDLAVVGYKPEGLTILLGNGKSGFTAVPGPSLKTGSLHVIADFDGDGKPDLLATSSSHGSGSRELTVLLGDGSGRFEAAPGSPFAAGGVTPSAVAVTDFDRDGKPDLAVGGGYDPKYLVVLLGKGDGRFGAATKIPLPANETSSLAVGDFNRDGKADLAVASAYDYGLTILLGDGRGGIRRASHYSEVFDYGAPSGIAVAKLDANGIPDLALAGDGVAVLLGNGKGGFRRGAESRLPSDAGEIAAADVDGDRRVDLVVSGAQGVTILFQTRSTPVVGRSRTPAGPPDAVFSIPGPVSLLAADGNRVATTSACTRIVVWDVSGRKSTSLVTHSENCAAPVLADGQVAWIEGGSGNTQEWEAIFAASLSGGKAKRIDKVERERSNLGRTLPGSYLGHLWGGGAFLAYNRWFCSHANPDSGDCDRPAKQQLVRIVGGRRLVVRRGDAAYALSGVGGARMAVVSGGAVTVLSASGSRIARVAALEGKPTRAAALARTRLAVERTFALDLYNPPTGRTTKSLPLGPAAALKLVSLNDNLALLEGRQLLVLIRLSDGKLISLPFRGAIDPQLTEAGLFYGYNTPKATMKGHIVFEPTAKLLRRF